MKVLFDWVVGILRGVVKVALLALTAVFVAVVLSLGLVIVLVAVVRFLLTGRKPAVVTTFARFNHAAQQFRPGGAWSGPARANGADVVDVEAQEVRPLPASLPPKAQE